jgi:hexosaminidase
MIPLAAFFVNALPMPLATPEPAIIPVPHLVDMRSGNMQLTSSSSVVAADNQLLPLAEILSEEIYMATGLRIPVVSTTPQAGDIVLKLDSASPGEHYTLDVKDSAVVNGSTYGAIAAGSVSLLQSIEKTDDGIQLPCMRIEDQPAVAYRGLMLDLARQYHSMDRLKQAVILCRMYKIKYLQLHLCDRGAFVFPSTAYPQLVTKGHSYTLEEFKELEQFATERGVILIPELDVPSHADALVNGMPEVFKCTDGINYTINFATPEALKVIDTLVGEMCEVFKATPYFHMGGDEIILPNPETNPDFKKAIEKNNLRDCMDLYRLFIIQLNEMAKKRDKQLIVWERFLRDPDSPVQIPKDVIVMEYAGHWYPAYEILEDGYTIINATGSPLYVVRRHKHTPEQIYNWHMYFWECYAPAYEKRHFYEVKPNPRVMGAQMCSWEQPQNIVIPSLRRRIPAIAERMWNPDAERTYQNFAGRLVHTDRLLDSQIHPVMAHAEGLIPERTDWEQDYPRLFSTAVTLSMHPILPNTEVRYTLDGSDPTTKSVLYESPLVLSDNVVTVKARLFDDNGNKIGFLYDQEFKLSILSAEATGTRPDVLRPKISEPPFAFTDTVTITLTASRTNGTIRYTLNGRKPTMKDAEYSAPISIDKTTRVRAQYFAPNGVARGEEWRMDYQKIPYDVNLATGKPVTMSPDARENEKHVPENAVDGWVIKEKFWGAGPYPQWWQVDLEKEYSIDKLHLFFYWDGKRYYQYTIEVSPDAKTWTKVVDKSTNKDKATEEGIVHSFTPVDARYIRVNMLKNSANIGVHIVEFRVYETR